MSSTQNRILVLVGTLIALFLGMVGVAAMAAYKPWGVRDSQRELFDTIVKKNASDNYLKDRYDGLPRPIAGTSGRLIVGWVHPNEAMEVSTMVRNAGEADLELALSSDTLYGWHLSLEKKTLKPGESTSLCLRGHGKDFIVPPSQQVEDRFGPDEEIEGSGVWLMTSDPLKREIELVVEGDLVEEFIYPDFIQPQLMDPGDDCAFDFLVESRQHEAFEVLDVRSNHEETDVIFDRVGELSAEQVKAGVRSAWKINANCTYHEYGKHAQILEVDVLAGQSRQTFLVPVNIRVRSPIVFFSPEMDRRSGLDVGTLDAADEHEFFVLTRLRGELHRNLEVLEVKPDIVNAELRLLKTEGNYQMRIFIPRNSPSTRFNVDGDLGFVRVGDPKDPEFNSWFYLNGAVTNTAR
ncbi:MAG: hypothetical protein AAF664_01835 [Planctomycetota bacterium]